MTDQEDKVEISYVPDDEDESHKHSRHEDEKDKSPHKKTTPKKRPTIKKIQKELKDKEELLEEMKKERDEYKDKYLRNLAEIDNFRKRVKKEKEEYQKYVLSEFLLELLQVYDNLERALKAKTPSQKKESVLNLLVSNDEQSIISGVGMIYKQFSDLLKKYRVVEIDALGKPFDPNIHQALSKEEKAGITDPVVVEEYQKGFMYNDKLLKPTLVKVAIPKEEEEEEEKETDADADADADADPDYEDEE
ncbi:MAG: nucleotide exchange factor GrpE [Candidatus Aminicenantes bacterium]|nr:MAG: nucleotide exchange factor GrpE [Candidatus Aminicenantes bacterium]